MADPVFAQLPVNADEGFPQAFRLALANRTYRVQLYVNAAEEIVDAALAAVAAGGSGALPLPQDGAFLVLGVSREDPAGLVPLLRRKLVPGVVYDARELAFIVTTMQVDVRNLGGAGSFGSQVIAGVSAT